MRWLRQALGTDSVDLGASLVADALRDGATAPVALMPIARRLRAAVRVEPLGVDGRLDVEGGRYVIRLRASGSWRRRRWTLAHELAHLAVVRVVGRDGGDPAELAAERTRRDLERFCDRVAARLLVDPVLMRARPLDELDRRRLFELYDRHVVSWEALLSQVGDAFGAVSASTWIPAGRPRGWRLDWQGGGRYLHELPHDLASERLDDDIVDIAWRSGEVRGTLSYTYDGSARAFEAMAVPLRRPPGLQLPLLAGTEVPDEDELPRVAVLLLDPILSGASCRATERTAFDPLAEFDDRFATGTRSAGRAATTACA